MSNDTDCTACPLAVDRRMFLRNAALATAAALVAAGMRPGTAFAETARLIVGTRLGSQAASYAIPAADGASIDAANDVIIARSQNRVYAFSLRCTHRGTRLEWHADEARLFCPKHKARFRVDGAHDSGRNARALDRYALRREGNTVIVQLDTLYRLDQDPAAWNASLVQLG